MFLFLLNLTKPETFKKMSAWPEIGQFPTIVISTKSDIVSLLQCIASISIKCWIEGLMYTHIVKNMQHHQYFDCVPYILKWWQSLKLTGTTVHIIQHRQCDLGNKNDKSICGYFLSIKSGGIFTNLNIQIFHFKDKLKNFDCIYFFSYNIGPGWRQINIQHSKVHTIVASYKKIIKIIWM